MAARIDIVERKAALLRDLRHLHQEQPPVGGGTAIKQRELSERYGLSVRTVSLALQELAEEGVPYTVPRIGTSLGRLVGGWPSMVCFDSAPRSSIAPSTSVISNLRLPWKKVGTEAAQLLWKRKNGRLTRQRLERLVQMQLIPLIWRDNKMNNRTQRTANCPPETGFTLIQLLVPPAIISLLAAILFPVFGHARENACRSACQSNFKQLGLGLLQHSQGFDERGAARSPAVRQQLRTRGAR